jgi:hypothetical protein
MRLGVQCGSQVTVPSLIRMNVGKYTVHVTRSPEVNLDLGRKTATYHVALGFYPALFSFPFLCPGFQSLDEFCYGVKKEKQLEQQRACGRRRKEEEGGGRRKLLP